MRTPQIVIVDDSRAIQAILSRSIRSCGIETPTIHAFSCGSDALAHVSERGADLVITDWHMPGMSGLELLQAVRQLRGGDIKVGMVTTESNEDCIEKARLGGATFIVNKPFSEPELHAALKSALTPHADAELPSAATEEQPDIDAQPIQAPESAQAGAAARLESALVLHFGPIRFRLVEQPQPSLAVFSPQIVLSLVQCGDGRVLRLFALDHSVATMLMGAALRSPPDQIKPLMSAKTLAAASVEHTSRFVHECAAQLMDGVAKVQSSVISRDMAKLRDAFAQADHVQAYKLQVPGYGEGYFALIRP